MNLVQIPPAVSDFTKGKYGISIGTSTALEGIFGIHENIEYPKHDLKPFKRFSNVVVNLRTILRNITSAVNTAAFNLITPEIALNLVIEEMRLLHEIVVSNSNKKLKVFWYAEMYPQAALQKAFPKAQIKPVRTTKQILYSQLEDGVFELLARRIEDGSIDIEHRISDKWFNFNLSSDCNPKVKYLDGNSEACLILSHLPLDLLLLSLPKKSLLESHTGRVKSEPQFISKLKGKPANIPFNLMTIQMFGDSGDMFSPQSIKIRNQISDIAKRSGWNPTTSKAKILDDCKNKGDTHVSLLVKTMYKKV